MAGDYILKKDSTQYGFYMSRKKVQMMAGGYANGKSTAMCIKIIGILSDYPGARALLARATYQQLQDTTMKTFFEWLPPGDIKSMPTKDDSTLYLKNGSTVKFGYIRQQGTGKNESVSNVLSAEYDVIGIDQIEDPQITHKDFTDMMGRLRRKTPYRGNDPTMPLTGPRWLLVVCNPTRNWVYRKIVYPFQMYRERGIQTPDLLVDDETSEVLLDVFSGSTMENQSNLSADYIQGMMASHKGAMRQRFFEGKWVAYDGLVYPDFDIGIHVVPHSQVLTHYKRALEFRTIPLLQGMDYGIASPTVYTTAFIDDNNNVTLVDGVYEAGSTPKAFSNKVQKIQGSLNIPYDLPIRADQSMFRRTASSSVSEIGIRVSDLYEQCGLELERATRDKEAGIITLNSYLHIDKAHRNPYTGAWGAPKFYVSDKCPWFVDEITDYYWTKSKDGSDRDVTRDTNDHALDAVRYMMTDMTPIATAKLMKRVEPPQWTKWHEMDVTRDTRNVRHR